MNMPNDISR